MSKLMELNLHNAPFHNVLPHSKRYVFRKVSFIQDYESYPEGYIEIDMSTHNEYVVLGFTGIRDLKISVDLLSGYFMEILDVSEYITTMPAVVRVQGGGISFWCDEVVLLDRIPARDA